MKTMPNFDMIVGSGVGSAGQASSSQETTMTPDVLYRDLIPQLNAVSIARFWDKIDKTPGYGPNGDCWAWTACSDIHGYGRLTMRPLRFLSHRLAWILEYGSLENYLKVLHKCDFPPCCRPDHLYKGTQIENVADCVRKGRNSSGNLYGEGIGNHKLSREQVLEIREKYNGVRRGYKAIGLLYGVSDVLIGEILRGQIWKNTDPIPPKPVKETRKLRWVARQNIIQPIGEPYRFIALTQEQYAIVDIEDYDWLIQWNWCAKWEATSGSFYAARASRRSEGGPPHTVRMHSQIMGVPYGDGRTVDHIDPDATLDNRRSNLRIATQAEQCRNMPCRNPSGYKGVTPATNTNRWQAQIAVGGKKIHLGYRDTAKEAHFELYVPAAKKLHGTFANLG